MKPVSRSLLVVAAVAAVLILVPLLLVLSLPKDRVRQLVVDKLQAQLHQTVRIRSADFRIFPDLRVCLEGIDVGGAAAPGRPHLAAASVSLGMQLLPLLARRVVITGIEIDHPLLENILAPAPPGTAEAASSPPSSPLDVRLQSLRIVDGRLALKLADGSPLLEIGGLGEELSAHLGTGGSVALSGETVIDTLRFHMVAGVFGDGLHLRLQEKLRYDLTAGALHLDQANLDLSGVPVAIEGDVTGLSAGAPRLDLRVHGGPGSLHDLVGLLPAQIFPQAQGLQSSGTLSLQGTVAGPAAQPDFHLALALENGRIQAPSLPQAIDGIVLKLRATPDSVVLDEFSAHSAQSSLRAHATLTGYRQIPRFLLAAQADLDLGAVSRFYAAKGNLQMSGRASLAVIAEGRADQPAALRLEGTARLSGVGISQSALPLPVKELNADLLFSNQNVTLRSSSVKLGASDFSADGAVENIAALEPGAKGAGRARLDLNLRSRLILFDEMYPTPSKGKTGIPPLPPCDGSFTFHADRISARGMEISQASGKVTLDQGVAKLEALTFGVFGGQIGLAGTLDLRRPSTPGYDLTGDATGLAVRDLFAQARSLNRFSGLAGSLSGSLNTHLAMKGTLSDSLLPDPRSLTSQGNLQINQAQLSGYPLQKAVSDFLGAPSLQNLQISGWKQGFHIEDGKLNVDALSLNAGPTEAVVNGWQSIDGQTQMNVDLLVPAALVSGLRSKLPPATFASVLFAGGDRVFVPLVLSGKSTAPSISIDTGKLTSAARQAAEARINQQKNLLIQQGRAQAGKLLQGVVPGTGSDSTKTGSIRKTIENDVKDRLGKLFGK